MIITVLAFDPGPKNMGMAVVRCKFVKNKLTAFKVLENGKLKHTVQKIQGETIRAESKPFENEIRRVLRRYDVTILAAERFMNRGQFSGNTGELVNIMLGIMTKIPVENLLFIPAAQWKNRWKGLMDLKATYKWIKVEPHQLDASCIGIYAACYFHGDGKTYFEAVDQQKLFKQIESTSTEKLINRVARKCSSASTTKNTVSKRAQSKRAKTTTK